MERYFHFPRMYTMKSICHFIGCIFYISNINDQIIILPECANIKFCCFKVLLFIYVNFEPLLNQSLTKLSKTRSFDGNPPMISSNTFLVLCGFNGKFHLYPYKCNCLVCALFSPCNMLISLQNTKCTFRRHNFTLCFSVKSKRSFSCKNSCDCFI